MFFGNSSSKLASVWFGDKERALSTALGSLAMPIGCIAGFVVPALMVSEEDLNDPKDGRKKFCEYLFVQNCIVSIAAIALIVFARSSPKTPPSASASIPTEVINVRKELKKLFTNKNYILLCVAFTCLNCICTCMGAVVSSVTQPYGYTGKDNALIGAVFIVFGVLGTIVISIMLDRYHKFKMTILITAILSVASLIAA